MASLEEELWNAFHIDSNILQHYIDAAACIMSMDEQMQIYARYASSPLLYNHKHVLAFNRAGLLKHATTERVQHRTDETKCNNLKFSQPHIPAGVNGCTG
jgi:hypothetical protein